MSWALPRSIRSLSARAAPGMRPALRWARLRPQAAPQPWVRALSTQPTLSSATSSSSTSPVGTGAPLYREAAVGTLVDAAGVEWLVFEYKTLNTMGSVEGVSVVPLPPRSRSHRVRNHHAPPAPPLPPPSSPACTIS